MKNNKVLSLIGLATKAGKTVSGEFSTEKSVKTGKGLLVIVAEDASENTKKKFRNMCSFYLMLGVSWMLLREPQTICSAHWILISLKCWTA